MAITETPITTTRTTESEKADKNNDKKTHRYVWTGERSLVLLLIPRYVWGLVRLAVAVTKTQQSQQQEHEQSRLDIVVSQHTMIRKQGMGIPRHVLSLVRFAMTVTETPPTTIARTTTESDKI